MGQEAEENKDKLHSRQYVSRNYKYFYIQSATNLTNPFFSFAMGKNECS